MNAQEPERALWVCVTCRARKKGCDKQLPKCGYCTRRGLDCVYHDAPPSHEQDYYPEALPASIARSESQGHGSAWTTTRRTSNSPMSSAPELPGSLYEFLGSVSNSGTAAGGGGLDDLLNREVTGIFQDQRMTLPDLAERYFRGFHKWLPIVSPTRFHEAASQAKQGTPPADFSLLVMAMYLISMPQRSLSSQASGDTAASSSMSSPYLMIKMLFAQTQAVLCASTALVQAGLMIAAYEYACQKLNPAYISIGTCIRIAHALGLDKTNAGLRDDAPALEPEQKLRMLEDWNVWWGVLVLERIIMVELAQIRTQPAAELPAQGSILPIDLKPDHDFSGGMDIDTDLLQRAPEAPFDSTQVESFGRQAQAVYLLDQVIRISNLESKTQHRQMELRRLDKDIQVFLGMVLEECARLQEFRCSVVATAVRALFILHEKALSQEVSALGENGQSQQKLLSEAALDTVTSIVSESMNDHATRLGEQSRNPHVQEHGHAHGHQHQHGHQHEQEQSHGHGHSHGHAQQHGDQQQQSGHQNGHEGGVDALPLCCVYSLKCAKRHIDRRQQQGAIEAASKDLEPLLSINKALLQRWSVTY